MEPGELPRLLLSHHPRCSTFSHHVLTIRGVDICLGCLATWPPALLTLGLLWSRQDLLPWLPLLLLLLLLELPATLSRSRWARALAKAFVGVGLGGVAALILNLPLTVLQRGLLLLLAWLGALAVALLKTGRLIRICRRCPHQECFLHRRLGQSTRGGGISR